MEKCIAGIGEAYSAYPAYFSNTANDPLEGIRMQRAVPLICAALLFPLAHITRASSNHPPTGKAAPCIDLAYRQFDFWIGDWDVFEIERPTAVTAHARVELILHGCVLHEVYEDLDGHKGESFSVYDSTRNTWHQSWVNDRGYLLTIEGHLEGKSLILEGVDHLPNDKLRQVRGEWRPDGKGVREVALRSTDGGASWVTWFDLSFRPHASSKKPTVR
jgi:hypothetical protein